MSELAQVDDPGPVLSGDPVAPGGAGRDDTQRAIGRRLIDWWPVLVPVLIVVIGAWIYRWVDEDAFIDFRMIDNLLAGHGLVYNLGERVEVDSDPLWIFTLAGLHEVFPFIALEWLSVLLGLVCTAVDSSPEGVPRSRWGVRGTSRRSSPSAC
jgi:hypothetical protein